MMSKKKKDDRADRLVLEELSDGIGLLDDQKPFVKKEPNGLVFSLGGVLKASMSEKKKIPTPQPSQLTDIATEIWATAQLLPGEGMEDGIARIVAVLKEHFSK